MRRLTIAMKIKQIREKKGWTQDQLSRKAGIHLVTLGRVEAGMVKDPALTTRKKLAKALGVEITELLD